MKPIEVPDYDDDRIFVPFTVPVKGKKPVEFKVPRRDFQPPEDVKTLQWLMTELDYEPDKLAELVDPDEPVAIEKACYLIALKPHVTAAQLKILKGLSIGALRFIDSRWTEQSRVTVGEYWASASTSTGSTPRPSNSNSSPSDGTNGTSEDDSDGQSSE